MSEIGSSIVGVDLTSSAHILELEDVYKISSALNCGTPKDQWTLLEVYPFATTGRI